METRPPIKSKQGDIPCSNPLMFNSEVNENVAQEKDNNLASEDFIIWVFYSRDKNNTKNK